MKLESLVKPPKGLELDEWAMGERNFDTMAYFEEWATENDFNVDCSTVWCLDETVGRMEDPIPGNFYKLVYNQHWGPHAVSAPLKRGITWGELWKVANALVEKSGDDHHIYIESFEIMGNTLVMWTGS